MLVPVAGDGLRTSSCFLCGLVLAKIEIKSRRGVCEGGVWGAGGGGGGGGGGRREAERQNDDYSPHA